MFLGLFALDGATARADDNTNFTVTVNQVIPDGNINGLSSSFTLSGMTRRIGSITVTLNVTNGYNGDLYAYLTHESGFSVLLNRVGRTAANAFGYGDTGCAITLVHGGNDVHGYQGFAPTFNGSGQLTGNWSPDGRHADPASTTDATARTTDFASQFVDTNPNGTWTLFFADMAGGGNPSTLVSWGLNIEGGAALSTPPIAVSDSLARHPVAGVKVRVNSLLGNDSDPDSEPFSLLTTNATSVAGGTVAVNEGWVFYTPPSGFTNADSFNYVVADSGGLQATGLVSIAIAPEAAPAEELGVVENLGNGSFRVRLRGILHRAYTIAYTESLESPTWQSLGSASADPLGSIEFIDTPPLGSPPRYYRTTSP